MTSLEHLRVRGRRSRAGCVFEWHPEDVDDASRLLAQHALVIKECYKLVDRRTVSDGDTVAVIKIWPESRTVEEIDVPDRHRRDRNQWVLEDTEATIQDAAGGLA